MSGIRHTSSGFTMIELLVVLAIIIVIASISVPTIESMTSPKHALRKEGLRVMQLMGEARTAAMARKAEVDLYVDPKTREIRMIETEAYRTLPAQDDFPLEYEKSTNRYEKIVVLKEDFELDAFAADEIETGEEEQEPFRRMDDFPVPGTEEPVERLAVSFNHLGGSDGGGISLIRDDVRLDIAADVLTGRPKIVKRRERG